MKRSAVRSSAPLPAGARQRMEAQAADWLARRDAGFTPAEAAEYVRWRSSNPRHAAVIAELEAAWALVNRPRKTGRAEAALAELAARARIRRARRRTVWTLASVGLAAAAAVLFVAGPVSRFPAPVAAPATSALVVQPEHRRLDDGSLVVLNSGAQIAVEFSAARRVVRLVRGEAHFVVRRDPARPFVVAAGGVEARAVGTEFAVSFSSGSVQVLVNEGRVAVACPLPAAATTEPVLVGAGTRITIPLASPLASVPEPEVVSTEELSRALAWRGQRVEFTGTPLGEAVALFNRRNDLQLVLGEPALASLRVSGCFWADHPEGFARLVESGFGLHTRRLDQRHIEIGR